MSRAEVLHWTPGDYLRDHKTARLTATEHGCYCLLLWNMWLATDEQCVFPMDYAVLGGIWKMCPEEASDICDSLMLAGAPLFKIVHRHKEPFLFSKRLHEQASAAKRFADAQSTKGRLSGAARRAKTANPGSTPVQPRLNPIEPSLSRSPVSPVDPSKTPVPSRSSEPEREERGSYPQARPKTGTKPKLTANERAYLEDKCGVRITNDQASSIARFLAMPGVDQAMVVSAIEVSIEKKRRLDCGYVRGCLTKWTTKAGEESS